MGLLSPKRALISVSDKDQLETIAKALERHDIEIISTGGTAKKLKEFKIPFTPIQKITGNPESFGGRMKSISFQIGSGLLFRRDHKDDVHDLESLGIKPIDIVICNLYPFKAVAKKTEDQKELIENIDIGGPTMIRAAAKNFQFVSCLTSPTQYTEFIDRLDQSEITPNYNQKLALDAFEMTAEYDTYIYQTLRNSFDNTEKSPLPSIDGQSLRYGENPHQNGKKQEFINTSEKKTLFNAPILQGKELSYNNYIDMDAAWKCNSELHHLNNNHENVVTIVKHGNPCGVCQTNEQTKALEQAWACDSISAFGSIICFNKEVVAGSAKWLGDKFIEIIIAPSFSKEAREILAKKKNLRLIECAPKNKNENEYVLRSIHGGILVQEEDEKSDYEFKSVTEITYNTELNALNEFGMIVNKYLKSNSIALVADKDNAFTIAGAGMGQPNRLDSLRMLAAPRAIENGYQLNEVVLISDAFFPFADSIEVAAELGIKNIVQPGGSIRDEEVIDACNKNNISMCFTATRHFRH